jgi:hypothetical protein
VKGRRGVLDIQAADWTKLVVLGLRFSPTNSFTTVIPYAFHY